jgi:hypothetical protein
MRRADWPYNERDASPSTRRTNEREEEREREEKKMYGVFSSTHTRLRSRIDLKEGDCGEDSPGTKESLMRKKTVCTSQMRAVIAMIIIRRMKRINAPRSSSDSVQDKRIFGFYFSQRPGERERERLKS